LKIDCGEVDDAIFRGVESPCEPIFSILGKKSDLGEVVYVMFLVGEWPLEHIICLPDFLKNDFGVVDEGHSNSCVSRSWKKLLGLGLFSDVLIRQMVIKNHNSTFGSLKKRICLSR
jgi:hypothetical protein